MSGIGDVALTGGEADVTIWTNDHHVARGAWDLVRLSAGNIGRLTSSSRSLLLTLLAILTIAIGSPW